LAQLLFKALKSVAFVPDALFIRIIVLPAIVDQLNLANVALRHLILNDPYQRVLP